MHYMMKKKHLLRNLIIIIGGFILLLVILAEIFKNDIVKLAIQRGAKTFDVPLSVGDVDFSLIYRFPLATIEFEDLIMTSEKGINDSVTIVPDTLARIKNLYASVDLWELIGGNIYVKKIDIEDADFKYLVDSLGKTNFDFLLEVDKDTLATDPSDTTVIQGVYSLEKLTLTDINIEYFDDFMKFKTSLAIPEVTVKGEVKPEGFLAHTEGEVLVRSIEYDDFQLQDLQKSRLLFDVSAMNDTLNVSEFTLDAAGAIFKGKGYVIQGDSLYQNLSISGTDVDLAKSFRFLPEKIKKELSLKRIEGILNVSGTTQGYLSPKALPQFDFAIDLNQGKVQYDVYPEVKNIELSVSFVNGYASRLESASVNIKKFHAETDQSKVNVSALVQNFQHLQYDVVADVSANLQEIKPYIQDSLIKSVGGLVSAKISTSGVLPDSISEAFYDYALNRTKLNVNLSGVSLKMDSLPSFEALSGNLAYVPGYVKMQGLKVKVPDYKVNLTNGIFKSSFKGNMSNYKNLSVKVDSLLLALDQQTYFSATGKIEGLDQVKYQLKSNIQLDMHEIYSMLPDSLANYMSGLVTAQVNSEGDFKMDSIADEAMALLFNKSDFKVKAQDVAVDMKDTTINVNALSGLIAYRDDSVFVNQLSGSYSGLDFTADSTYISKVYSAAVLNQPEEMHVFGNFTAGDFDYALIESILNDTDTVPMPEEEMKALMEEKKNEEPYEMKFTYKVNGNVNIKSFKYGDILAEHIDSKFLADISNGTYVAEDLDCDVFGGGIKGGLRYTMTDIPTDTVLRDVLEFRLSADSIDVSRMIDDLQVYLSDYDITKENVQGLLSSKMDGRIVLLNYEPAMDSIMMSGDLKLENGALIDIKAITDLKDIPGNNIPNLDNMRFYTLTSNLFIYRNKIFIPKTDIFSNSLEASFLGMYSFNGEYDFRVRVLLGQILAGKVKKRSKEELESGFDPDDKGRYYKTSYLDGKSKAWFDNKNDRKVMDTRIRMNKRGLQVLFAPNLIVYDTGVE